jgi:hypothetical protein
VKVNFARSDFKRSVADAADLILRNRYFEENPALSDDGSALLARPGLKYFTTVGSGPIRGLHSEPGAFSGDLFVASGDELYRVNYNGQALLLLSNMNDPDVGVVNMAITQAIGAEPEHLFIADGRNLWVYEGATATATNTLLASGAVANGDQVRIGDIYYQFTNASVDAGAPAGTAGNPWLVALGASTAEALENLFQAINGSGTAGTDYSTSLAAHNQVTAIAFSPTTVVVEAAVPGVQGNSIVTTETGANLAWTGGGALAGGVGGSVTVVATPDDVGIFDVVTIASYVICIPVQVDEFIGRFYWIEPGEITIDPLDFATAESYPDRVMGVRRFGDQFWLPGERSTEVWYATGDPSAPMQRLQGVVFDRGTWEGTAVAIKETLIVVDGDGGVFAIRGGAPQRVSTPGIEEQIRKAIAVQQNLTP